MDEFDVAGKWVYFNHAGVSPLPKRTRRAKSRGGEERSGIVSFRAKGDPGDLAGHLREGGFYVVCREGLVRASPHYYKTLEEVKSFLGELRQEG